MCAGKKHTDAIGNPIFEMKGAGSAILMICENRRRRSLFHWDNLLTGIPASAGDESPP